MKASLLLTVYPVSQAEQVNGLSYGVTKTGLTIGPALRVAATKEAGCIPANNCSGVLAANVLGLAFNLCLDYFTRPTKLPRHATYTRLTQVETKSPPLERTMNTIPYL